MYKIPEIPEFRNSEIPKLQSVYNRAVEQLSVVQKTLSLLIVIVIVIINSKLLKRHLKAKCRAPAYSRALRQIRGVFQRIVRGRLRSVFQRVRECVKSEVFSKE